MQGSHDDYLVFNKVLKTSLEHRIWANGEFKEAKDIKIGDFLLNSDGQEVEVTKIEYVQEEVETYDLVIEKNHNFFVSDYLVHNPPPSIGSEFGSCTQVYVEVDYTPESSKGLINTTTGATPFYTNVSNPYNISLEKGNSSLVVFWVNATGGFDTYEFFAYANKTDYASISNITDKWDVTIIQGATSYSIDLSPSLSSEINWTLSSLPVYNQSAYGNNDSGNGVTEYYVDISTEGGTVDLYIKANDDLLTQGLDRLGITNETYSYNLTNSSVPSDNKFSLTTDFNDNKIEGLSNGTRVYFKFYLNAPSGQAAGTYNNSLTFKAVSSGQSP